MARKSRKHVLEEKESIIYRTAIYARLSRENPQQEKIETQIKEIQSYILKKSMFRLTEIYADNDYSGMNFNRPAFQQMMEDLRNRKIDCIVVRDLSRFAREHIGAEDYLNNIFPFLGVRFISIRDDYDNVNIEPQQYFIASFKNFAHAYMAQETSRKVGTIKRQMQEQGKFIGSKVSYGYMRDPSDKHKLIPEPEQAVVIQEIFQRVSNGENIRKICDKMIGGTICCLLAIAVIGCFGYIVYEVFASLELETENAVTNWQFANKIYAFSYQFANANDMTVPMLAVCFGAVFVELLLHEPINYTLRKLPLGHIPLIKQTPKLSILYDVIPALITGIYLAVFLIALEFEGIEIATNIVNFCKGSGVIVVAALDGIVLLALFTEIVTQSGFWGLILRGSLIVIMNFGLSIICGVLFAIAGMAIIAVMMIIVILIVMYAFLRAMAIASFL